MRTGIFSLSPGLYSSIVMKRLAAEFWWILLVPVIVLLALGSIFSTVWLFLIPILVFLLYPLLVMWAYYLTALSDEAMMSMTPHSVSSEEEGIRIRRYGKKESDGQPRLRQRLTVYEDSDVVRDPEKDVVIPKSDLSAIDHTDRYLVYRLGKGHNRLLIVPREVIVEMDLSSENKEIM